MTFPRPVSPTKPTRTSSGWMSISSPTKWILGVLPSFSYKSKTIRPVGCIIASFTFYCRHWLKLISNYVQTIFIDNTTYSTIHRIQMRRLIDINIDFSLIILLTRIYSYDKIIDDNRSNDQNFISDIYRRK